MFFIGLSSLLCSGAALFAQDGAEAPTTGHQGGSLMQTVIMIVIALVFFYFILWRPEQKRRKEMDKKRSGLKKGDRVTAMGIIGTVVKIQDTSIILKMVDGSTKIEVLKAAITDVVPGTEEDAKKAEVTTVEHKETP